MILNQNPQNSKNFINIKLWGERREKHGKQS